MINGSAQLAVLVFQVITISSFISFLVAPMIAMWKGYAPYFWMFACGPVGLVVMLFFPSLHSAKNPEQREILETRANMIGGILSGIALLFALPGMLFLVLYGIRR